MIQIETRLVFGMNTINKKLYKQKTLILSISEMVLKNSIEFYAIMSKFEMFDDIQLDEDDELYKCFACVSMIEHLEEQSLLTFKQVASLE